MLFQRNIQFTLLIRADERLREFNFRKRNPERYDVDSSDERGSRFFFQTIKTAGEWTIQGENLPGWITGNAQAIAQALGEKDAAEAA